MLEISYPAITTDGDGKIRIELNVAANSPSVNAIRKEFYPDRIAVLSLNASTPTVDVELVGGRIIQCCVVADLGTVTGALPIASVNAQEPTDIADLYTKLSAINTR